MEARAEIEYKIKEDKCPFSVTFIIENNTFFIKVLEVDSVPSVIYNTKLTLTILTKLSKYFRMLDTIEEFIPELKDLCNYKKIKIKKGRLSVDLILSLSTKVVDEVHLINIINHHKYQKNNWRTI